MQSFEQDLQDADKCVHYRILALVGDVTKQVVKQMTGLRLGKGDVGYGTKRCQGPNDIENVSRRFYAKGQLRLLLRRLMVAAVRDRRQMLEPLEQTDANGTQGLRVLKFRVS